MDQLEKFYYENQYELDQEWEEYFDCIIVTSGSHWDFYAYEDDIFWEWLERRMEEETC